ncbi:MAG: galactokinase, partial [Proteobacteria bacterium]|nr:galactokinase [Pseudomonadota bacterium]
MKSETAQLKNRILDAFEKEYGESPQYLISAPGRVNLIGEYTDLAQGFVLPMAIDRYLMVACRKRRDRQVRVLSLDYGESKEFS